MAWTLSPPSLLLLSLGALSVLAAPPSGFPSSGNGLWYDSPGTIWSRHWLPVGNGYMGLMTPGGTTQERTLINLESLWSGGPFSDKSYNGGNHDPSEREKLAEETRRIRETIFASSDGSIEGIANLTSEPGNYGSYSAAGHLISTLDLTSGDVTNYARWLDMDQALLRTSWTQGGADLTRTTFCSYPSQACIQHLNLSSTDNNSSLPSNTFAYASSFVDDLPTPTVSCFDNQTLSVRGTVEEPDGMLFEILVRVFGQNVTCDTIEDANATVTVQGGTESWALIVGNTNYNIDAGDEAHQFSFQGEDPHDALVSLLSQQTSNAEGSSGYQSLLEAHLKDVSDTLTSPFSLSLGQVSSDNYAQPTDQLRASYKTDEGNPYVEWLLFNYGRYMLWGSARGVLPANLQGIWASGYGNPWSADYHANINVQMNYWIAESTGLGGLTNSLWDYMEKTWAPRGQITANVLYNISRGWTTHNEMNIFGHTGMKKYEDSNTAQWANYPEANAWMAIHIWDHFDYTNDIAWLKEQGWPLLKGIASFHLDKLLLDTHFNDSTLVTAPCNSPEQELITFGCAHQQQLIWQLFNAIEKGYGAAGETDQSFLEEIRTKRSALDKGIHIGSWGQLQEWKVEHDDPDDTHRHLSHLIGLYPGYAVASYDSSAQGNYTRDQVLQATSVSLEHRGDGTGPDADAGWEKVWRAAAWAQLKNSESFYHILTYALERDFGENLWSLYNPSESNPIFQIDANLGYPAAVLNALVQVPDTATADAPLVVTVLPALPSQWSSGSVKGLVLRGGLQLDLEWSEGKLQKADVTARTASAFSRQVQVVYAGQVIHSFGLEAGQLGGGSSGS